MQPSDQCPELLFLVLQAVLHGAMQHRLQHEEQQLRALVGRLHAYSPLATLERGYALPLKADGHLLHSIRETKPGEALALRLRDGWVDCRVEATRGED